MNLILDIGNSRTKVACFENDQVIELKIFDSLQVCDLEFMLRQHTEIGKCILASTVYVEEGLLNYLKNTFSNFIELTGNSKLPFDNNYESKKTLGADRIAAIAGTQMVYPGSNVLVIDAGTAITFDFIDVFGNYLGGNISPGIGMRFKSLHTFTQKLPLLTQDKNFDLLGNNTSSAIISGVQNGVVFEIEGYINQLKNNYPQLKTIITGGDAEFLANKLKSTIFVDLNLVLKGLNRILEYNAD